MANDKLIIINRVQNFISTLEQLKNENLIFERQSFSFKSLKFLKDDPFDFFMDLLGIMRGPKFGIQGVLTAILGDIDGLNIRLKSGLKKMIINTFFCNNDFIVLPQYTDGTNDIEFKISDIDYFFLLKTSPIEDVSGAYETTSGLNRYIYEMLNGSATNSWESLLTNVSFNQSTQILSLRINPKYINQPVSVFVNDYVDSLTILDSQFFKSLFSVSQKPNKELNKRLRFLNKFINDIKNACSPTLDDNGDTKSVNDAILNDLLTNKGKSLSDVLSESVSKYTEFDALENDFNNKINQILCQPLETPLDSQSILDAYDQINNEINALNNYINNIDSVLNNSYQKAGENGLPNPIDESNESLINLDIDFKLGIIIQIPNNIARLMLSPKVIMLFAIMTELGGLEWGEGFETFIVKYTKALFEMIKKIISEIYRKIYDMIEEDIKGIIKGLIIKILKETLKGRLTIILSLLDLFDKLQGIDLSIDLSNCRSILDGLKKLTNLTNIL